MSKPKFGRYEIKSELGRGGMATVYHAYDPSFKRDVALKVLPPGFLNNTQLRLRFEREAVVIASLEHPAIVPVYDNGEQEGQPYIVMRYMSGGSLSNRLAGGGLPLEEAASIVTRLAQALDAAHSRGIIHRDLKPGNVLFDQYGNAFLSDFGIARLAEQEGATLTGSAIIGTPAYMSPEQVQGDKTIDQRSDIYALGVMAYQMLTGNVPYRADTPARVMLKHLLEAVPNILDARADLPAGCDQIIRRAMAKDPGSRYATSLELASELDSIARGQPPALASQLKPSVEATLIESPAPVESATTVEKATAVESAAAVEQATTADRAATVESVTPDEIATQIDSATLDPGAIMASPPGYEQVVPVEEAARPKIAQPSFIPLLKKRFPLLAGLLAALVLLIAGGYQILAPRQEAAQISTMEVSTANLAEMVSTSSTQAAMTEAAQSTEIASSAATSAFSTEAAQTSQARLTEAAGATATQLALSKLPQGKIVYTCQIFKDPLRNQVCIVNADGSGWRRLSSDDSADHTYPAFSPDGQNVLVSLEKQDDHQIYEIDLDGKQRQLTDLPFGAYAPAVSPNNRWILFTANDGSHQTLWIMGRDGANPRALTFGSDGDAWDATWSPDGEEIVFASNRAGGVQLFIMDVDGSKVRQLTQMEGLRGRNDWSPDGQSVATYMGGEWEREIILINMDGSLDRQLTEGGNNLAPNFSPDGQYVVFTSYRDNYRETSGCEIYIMRLDGKEVTRLTENDYCDWQPSWGS